jgi:hypothetical protein
VVIKMPKSFAEIRAEKSNYPILSETITWDGVADSATVEVPAIGGHCLMAVENGSDQALTLTFEHRVYYEEFNAAAKLGDGTDGTVNISIDEPGPGGNDYSIGVALGTYVDEDIPLSATLDSDTKKITVTLATGSTGGIDAENTASDVAAEINKLSGISAEATGEGTGVIAPTDGDVSFDGGYAETLVPIYGLDDQELKLTVAAEKSRAFEPLGYFPRFYGGVITLTATEAPTDKKVTTVYIREV